MLTAVPLAGSIPAVLLQASNGLDGWADTLADIATIMIALAMIAIAIALILLAVQSRRIYGKIHRILDRAYDDTTPILRHVQDVADNVNYISAALRADADTLRSTLASTQASLTEAAQVTEQRMSDFNALLGVVQEEAEQIFIDTASTIRGVQSGARTLRRPDPGEWIEEIDAVTNRRAPAHERSAR